MTTLSAEDRKALAEKKRLERQNGAVSVGQPSEPEAAPARVSILKKAGSLGAPSTLVVGGSGTGKSTLVRNLLLKNGARPVWLPLNNASVLDIPEVAEWPTAVPSDWNEYMKGIVQPALNGEFKDYNALVIDGGNVLAAMAVSKQAPTGQAELKDWLVASNLLRDSLVRLRDRFGSLYVIIDVVTNAKDGGRKIDLNPYTKNIIVPLFGNKFYTHLMKERGEGNKLTGKLIYTVQRNPALALEFTMGEPVELEA